MKLEVTRITSIDFGGNRHLMRIFVKSSKNHEFIARVGRPPLRLMDILWAISQSYFHLYRLCSLK